MHDKRGGGQKQFTNVSGHERIWAGHALQNRALPIIYTVLAKPSWRKTMVYQQYCSVVQKDTSVGT